MHIFGRATLRSAALAIVLSVRLSVCHTCELRMNGWRYRYILYTIWLRDDHSFLRSIFHPIKAVILHYFT